MSESQTQQLISIVHKFQGRRILVVGDVMLDEYIWGDVTRISPEAPVPILQVLNRSWRPGGAANDAVNVVSLGGQSILLGIVGADANAELLKDVLFQEGVNGNFLLVDENRPTTTKTRLLARNQQIVRMDVEHRNKIPDAIENVVLVKIQEFISSIDAIILADYDKGVITPKLAQTVIKMACDAGVPVIIDPKKVDFTCYCGATLVTPNIHEAQLATGVSIQTDNELYRVGEELFNLLGGAVLITRGIHGMTLFLSSNKPLHVPAQARTVYDVSGAGDTVVATIALVLSTSAGLVEAVYISSVAAGIVVGKLGTATVTVDELVNHLSQLII